MQEFWSTIIAEDPVWNWHIEYLCDELQVVYMRAIKRLPKEYDLIINVPPGSTKSTIASVMVQAWAWAVDPSLRLITASYSEALSTEHAMYSRNIITSEKYKELFPDVELKRDENNKTNYKTTKGGQRVVAYTGGRITGIHAHVNTMDDPLNVEQSYSEIERKKACRFMNTTLSQRTIDKAVTPMILIMQRLHELDPTGDRLTKKSPVKHICLPAEASKYVNPPELLDRYVDGLLDPIRISAEVVQDQKQVLGSMSYAGQYGQRPAPEDGGIVKKHWFDIVDRVEDLYKDEKRFITIFNFYADTAYTEKTKNDPTGLIATFYYKNILYILDAETVHKEFPELIAHLKVFTERNGYSASSRFLIEPKASGLSVIQTARKETNLNVIAAPTPKDSKITRTYANQAFMEAKRVKLIKGAWNDAFLLELAQFPNGAHDEYVDLLNMAIQDVQQPQTDIDIL